MASCEEFLDCRRISCDVHQRGARWRARTKLCSWLGGGQFRLMWMYSFEMNSFGSSFLRLLPFCWFTPKLEFQDFFYWHSRRLRLISEGRVFLELSSPQTGKTKISCSHSLSKHFCLELVLLHSIFRSVKTLQRLQNGYTVCKRM